MKYISLQMLNANDDVSRTSGKLDCDQLISVSFHFIFSDTDVGGTVKVQASNDPLTNGNAATFTPSHWVDVPNQSATITSGSSALLTLAQISYRWVRVLFTQSTPGTGTVVCNMFGVSI